MTATSIFLRLGILLLIGAVFIYLGYFRRSKALKDGSFTESNNWANFSDRHEGSSEP
ncbi:hypothetical protein [Pseudovibrio ascidiaceicola]|uniref:hypothetical protein n=1 Tax=Pseudovibrio ascidiaceicola TaxID=285279 RepID=UPI001359EE14|nr:hypothetical protein [Pseudovibrio ascidiaceicola]